MDFFKRLFGGDRQKKKTTPARKPLPPLSARKAMPIKPDLSNKSIEELVQMLVHAPAQTDWREVQMAEGQSAGISAKAAWDALEAIRNKSSHDTLLQTLQQHIDKPRTTQYHRAFSIIRDEAIPVLIETLKTENNTIRLNVLSAFTEMNCPEAVDAIEALIHDEDREIRAAAVKTLGHTKHPRAYQILQAYDYKNYEVTPSVYYNALRIVNVPASIENIRTQLVDNATLTDTVAQINRSANEKYLQELETIYEKYWQE